MKQDYVNGLVISIIIMFLCLKLLSRVVIPASCYFIRFSLITSHWAFIISYIMIAMIAVAQSLLGGNLVQYLRKIKFVIC